MTLLLISQTETDMAFKWLPPSAPSEVVIFHPTTGTLVVGRETFRGENRPRFLMNNIRGHITRMAHVKEMAS